MFGLSLNYNREWYILYDNLYIYADRLMQTNINLVMAVSSVIKKKKTSRQNNYEVFFKSLFP